MLGLGLQFGRVGKASKAAKPRPATPLSTAGTEVPGPEAALGGLGSGGGWGAAGELPAGSRGAVTCTSFLPPRPWLVSEVTVSLGLSQSWQG